MLKPALYLSFILAFGLLQIGCTPPQKEKSLSLSKINIVVFLGVECPISQQYSLTLEKLKDQFDAIDSMTFTAIFPEQISLSEANEFLNTYTLSFDPFIDKDLEWVKKLNASVTPEVFILTQDYKILYQGAIDNWYVRLGENRQHISQHFLGDNLQALINGANLPYPKTKAIGCLIEK
ncbi:MAG: hypothetical protein AAF843_13700 [Bacteroidota bacterium]